MTGIAVIDSSTLASRFCVELMMIRSSGFALPAFRQLTIPSISRANSLLWPVSNKKT